MTSLKTERLGERLRRLRQERKLAAAEMARMIGVAPTTYREWEKGRGLMIPPFLKISQVLAVSVTELLSGEEPKLREHLQRLEEIEKLAHEARVKLGAIT